MKYKAMMLAAVVLMLSACQTLTTPGKNLAAPKSPSDFVAACYASSTASYSSIAQILSAGSISKDQARTYRDRTDLATRQCDAAAALVSTPGNDGAVISTAQAALNVLVAIKAQLPATTATGAK